MITAADVREWRNQDVVDPKGHKIGVLEAVYVDTSTDEPAMATVLTGLPTRRRLVFVPLDEAILGPHYVKVPYPRGWSGRPRPSGRTTCCPPIRRRRSSSTTRWSTGRARPANAGSHAHDRADLLPRPDRPPQKKEMATSWRCSCSSSSWPSSWD